MTKAEKEKLKEVVEAMSKEEKLEAIQYFPSDLLANEFNKRMKERTMKLVKLDEILGEMGVM